MHLQFLTVKSTSLNFMSFKKQSVYNPLKFFVFEQCPHKTNCGEWKLNADYSSSGGKNKKVLCKRVFNNVIF